VTVAELAAELLSEADERMGSVDEEWVTYDHAAAEAVVFVSGCLDQIDDPAVPEMLQIALAALAALPIPTGRGVLMAQVRAELARRGRRLQPVLRIA
jgi:hypothetical protein